MPNVSVPDIAPGTTTSASSTNTFFTDLQTASAAIDGTNTRAEWCSRQHIDQTAATPVFNTGFAQVSSTASQTLNAAAWTQINMGTAFRITPASAVVLAPGQVLRLHFDTLVTDYVYPAPPAGGVITNRDCYQFRFASNLGAFNCVSTYSTSIFPRTVAFEPADFVAKMNTTRRKVQRVNHSLCYINDTGAPITYNWFEVQGQLANLTWLTSITINFGQFSMLVGRF